MENEEEMSKDQPSQELAPLDLFNQDVTDTVKDLYNPIFSKIRVFGDIYDPVFIAKDVQDALGLKDMNYRREGIFEWDIEKVKVRVQTRAGMQDVIALTEQGLYKAIWHSKTEMAKKFQIFMKVIMKRLRMTGRVTIEDAADDYKKEVKKLAGENKILNIEIELKHKELTKLRDWSEYRDVKYLEQASENYKLKEKLKNVKEPSLSELQERVDRLERKYMRPVIVMLSAPPKEHEEVHQYELEFFSPDDEDLVDSSETMIYSLGLTPLKSKVAIAKLYVHKDVKLEDFHKKLEMYRLTKADSGYYQNAYEISLDLLHVIKDDLNREHESRWD